LLKNRNEGLLTKNKYLELVNLKHVEKETEDPFFLPGGEDLSLN
jgi:hypothetical protein